MSLASIEPPSQKKEGMSLHLKLIVLLALIVAIVAVAFGIAARVVAPLDEIHATEVAIQTARSARAELYEPELIQKAQSDYQLALAEAKEQEQRIKLFRSYAKSVELLKSASDAARDAYKRATASEKEARSAKAAIDLADIQIKAGWESLKWMANRFSRADMGSMKETLKDLETDIQKAKELLDRQEYTKARETAVSVMRRSNDLGRRIRQAT